MAIFIPPLVWADVAIAGAIIILTNKINNPPPKPPTAPTPAKIIFLMGEGGVGKNTIREILKNAQFIKDYYATPEPHLSELINQCGYNNVQIYNTGGADGQVEMNNKARRNLLDLKKYGHKIYYVYVFDANKYFSKSKTKETIRHRLQTAKEFAQPQNFEFRIIGTHRDEAQKYESKMNDLSNELRGDYGECEIYDLTQAKTQGKQMQEQLLNFILGSNK